MVLTEQQEKKLRHMLGAEPGRYRKNEWGFRNHYAASPGGSDYAELKTLETEGLVTQGRVSETLVFFHATEMGCRAIGMVKKQIERAFKR